MGLAIASFENFPPESAAFPSVTSRTRLHKNKLANGVSEAAFRNRKASLNCKPRTLFVGGEEDLKGRIMGDLGEEGARSAEDQDRIVAGLLPKESSDLACWFGEVGGDCHVRLRGLSASHQTKPKQPEGGDKSLSSMSLPIGNIVFQCLAQNSDTAATWEQRLAVLRDLIFVRREAHEK